MKEKLFLLWIVCFLTTTLSANETNDTMVPVDQELYSEKERDQVLPDTTKTERVEPDSANQRNLRYNILGGPSYTPDLGLLIGGSALATFRINPEDKDQMRSVVPIGMAVMFKGGFNVTSRPQLFFKDDRFRIFGEFLYKNMEDNYYGVGYSTNRDYIRSDSTSQYRYNGIQINPWFLFRLGTSGFFVGPQLEVNYDKMKKPAKYLIEDPAYIAAGGTSGGYSNFSTGLGFVLTYDTRDVPANSYRGIYLNARGMVYGKYLGSDNNFYNVSMEYRQYQSVGNRRTLAWMLQSQNVYGNVPLNKYTLTGTPFDLRGYYRGQYRDKSSHTAIVEYRQMINTSRDTRFKRLLHHLGFAAWTGCGFMGPTMGKIEGVLPNYGAGLRIEVQPRMNVRLDIGKNTVNNQTLFYFNMTEAF
ncbi:MAG: BamA/TamA family outer membrane protein [Bacteroides sp.]|nr:BamA/TamA family outer membrane protein [Bacteroides sp.]